MNRSIVAGAALIAGIAIAAPMPAWSAVDDAPLMAQAGPEMGHSEMGHSEMGHSEMGQSGMGHSEMGRGGMEMGEGQDGEWGHNERGEHGERGRHGGGMGWMHRMMQMSPQQRCEERIARRAGVIAYTIAKLKLTAEQQPLWARVQAPLQQAGERERALCATLKPREQRGQETLLDRMNQHEQFLSARLQAVQQIKPAVQEFYQALTPEQKAIVDHPFMRH
jgi:hypothetical protein